MNKQSNDIFWAFIISVLAASTLSALAFILPRSDKAEEDLYRIADGLVTGSLGFFAGRAASNPTTPVDPATKEQS